MGSGAHFSFWWSENGPLGTFEDRGGHFGWAGVLSVSVESAMECRTRDNMDVFCAVFLRGAMRFAMPVLLEEKVFGGNAKL